MKKLTLIAMAVSTLLITGCTSYAGISKADKPGSYYIVENTYHIWVTPGVKLCKSKSDTSGGLNCKSVNVD